MAVLDSDSQAIASAFASLEGFLGLEVTDPGHNFLNDSLISHSYAWEGSNETFRWPSLASVFKDWPEGSASAGFPTLAEELETFTAASTTAATWIHAWEMVVVNYTDPSVFWTAEDIQLLRLVPWQLHFVLGCLVTLVGILGSAANGLILLISTRFRRLRSPANIFIMNLATSDFCASILHPMAAYSSFNGRWAFGKQGCEFYGMGVGFFGLNSIVTLTAIAWERYVVITSEPFGGKWRITRRRAQKVCVLIWLYCAALVLPPLWGVSAYIPEGLRTTCSWDYSTRTLSNRLYYFYLLFFGFLLPVAIITYCYGVIFKAIVLHSKEMTHIAVSSQKTFMRKARRKTDIRTAQIIVTLVVLFLVAWTPYAIVSLVGQFGSSRLTNPLATTLPAFFAKTSIVVNPLVYGFSHPHFRSSVKQYLGNLSSSTPFNPPATPRLSNATSRRKPSDQPRSMSFKQSNPFDKFRGHSEPNPPSRGGYVTRVLHPSQHLPPHSFSRSLAKPNLSEPDLMRCSERVIPGAATMSYVEYRRKKRSFLQKMFFRSESLLQVGKVSDGNGGDNRVSRPRRAAKQSASPFSSSNDSLHVLSAVSSSVACRKGRRFSVSSAHGRFGDVNRKMLPTRRKSSSSSYNSVIQSLKQCPFYAKNAHQRRETITMLNDVIVPHVASRRTSTGTLLWRTRGSSVASTVSSKSLLMSSLTCNSSGTLPRTSQPKSYSRGHANCCECAQQHLSRTITLASVPEGPGRSRLELCIDDSPRSSIF